MKTSISHKIKHALLIDSDNLKSIDQMLQSKYSTVVYNVRCIDGSNITFNNLESLFNFENMAFRRINEIVIEANNSHIDSVEISIESEMFSTCSIYLTSDDDAKAVWVMKEIKSRIKEMRPSYSLLTFISPTTGTILFLVGLFWILSILQTFNIISKSPKNISFTDSFNFLIMFYIGIAILTYPFNKLWKYLFPKLYILIGIQIKAYKKIETLRKTLFVTILLTGGIGIIVNIITHFMLN